MTPAVAAFAFAGLDSEDKELKLWVQLPHRGYACNT